MERMVKRIHLLPNEEDQTPEQLMNKTRIKRTTANQDDMQKMDEIDYADFGLSVDYANNDEYEAELEKNSNNSVEAKIDDTLNQVKNERVRCIQ